MSPYNYRCNRRTFKWHLGKFAERVALCALLKNARISWHHFLHGWIGLLLVSAAATGSAAEINTLYAAWVPVDNQQETTRIAALKTALARVFVKVSGERTVLQQAELSQALADAPTMVQQYSYQSRLLTAGDDPRLGLWVAFEKPLVNDALREAKLQTWGNIRPAVLVWMALNDKAESAALYPRVGSSGEILTQTEALSIMRQVENHRGVSLVLSQQQSDLQSGINMANLQDIPDDTIRNVSARYAAEAVLIARTQRTAGGFFETDWTFYIAHVQQRWTTVEDNIELTIEEGFQRCVDRLAAFYLDPAPTNKVARFSVIVSGITGFNDFTRALQALRQSDRTHYVQPSILFHDKAVFSVSVRGSASVFLNVISLGGVLSAPQATAAHRNTHTTLQLMLSPR